jgi:ribosomal protein S18 acetylase RimI-like enzyme
MTIVLGTPTVDDLGGIVRVLREWQHDDTPLQLHPGDVGWFWRFGAEATAAALRTWTRDGEIVAVGLLDGPDLVRMTTSPGARYDAGLAQQVVQDITDPERGVLGRGRVAVETPQGALIRDQLSEVGWRPDEAWTPLRRDLAQPVEDPGVRVGVVGAEQAEERALVQRAAFEASAFTAQRWHAMAAAPTYEDARCLLAYDLDGEAVAVATVWSAGPGRPGLLEPMGVHRDHRGRGYGRAISVAAAAALQQLGSSSAIVCTPSSNLAGLATYRSAGYQPQPERADRFRET